MKLRQWPLFAVLICLCSALFLVSCNTPDAVSKFCASAQTTLNSGGPIFDDMKQSCLREVNSRKAFGEFKPLIQTDPGCTEIGTEAEALQAASKIVADYFGAINGVASFGTAKVADDFSGMATKVGAATKMNSAGQTAAGALAKLLANIALSGYQQKQLSADIPKVKADIDAVLAALELAVQQQYLGAGPSGFGGVLQDEEAKQSVRYREFLKAHPSSPDVLLSLNDRWLADQAALAAKRASAKSYCAALEVLAKGFDDLAAHANHITAKELPGLLSPYGDQLQALVPAVQKAF